jgi:hypothetical protein
MRDDIHPEELLVRDARRVFSEAEEADLRVHLARCPGCALQVSLRADVDAALAPTDVDYDVGARAVERLLSSRSWISVKPSRIQSVAAPEAVWERVPFSRLPFPRLPFVARVAAVLLMLLGTGVGASALVLGTHGRLWGKVAPAEAPVSAERPHGVLSPRRGKVAVASPENEAAIVVAAPAPLPDPLPAARGEGVQILERAPVVLRRDKREALPNAAPPVEAAELPALALPAAPPAEPAAPATLEATATSAPSESAADLFGAAESARREGHAREALRLYERLEAAFAGSREGMTALVFLGQMLLDDLGAPTEAEESFERYLLEQPNGALAEEARVGRAQALWRLGRASEEAAAWNELLVRHPRSLHAALARGRLAALAKHGD